MEDMTCSQCWATVPKGTTTCPHCRAKITGAPPSLSGLMKSRPWIAVLLSLSLFVTLWAATRRPAPPKAEVIPPAEEPVAPPPAPEAESETVVAPPVFPAPEPESAPVAAPMPERQVSPAGPNASPVGALRPDGTWESGPGAPKRGGP